MRVSVFPFSVESGLDFQSGGESESKSGGLDFQCECECVLS